MRLLDQCFSELVVIFYVAVFLKLRIFIIVDMLFQVDFVQGEFIKFTPVILKEYPYLNMVMNFKYSRRSHTKNIQKHIAQNISLKTLSSLNISSPNTRFASSVTIGNEAYCLHEKVLDTLYI